MLRVISTVGFAVIFVGLAYHYAALRRRGGDFVDGEVKLQIPNVFKKLIFSLTLLFLQQRLSPFGIFKRLVYLVVVICFVILAVTGFCPLLVLGKSISGYLLMVHVTTGGIFASCLAVLAVVGAGRYCFDERDWCRLLNLVRSRAAEENENTPKPKLGLKITFWLIILLSLPVFLSIVLSMFRLFGTNVQELLLKMHGYSAFLLTSVGIGHIYLMTLAHKRRM